ncbi:MAG: 3-hydroxyacyl-CoA dehydrogenase family protein [Desulfobulbaceae bacterium]|jgi:3-hydroxybutyryl-CoA dehydrogenase|nr:3-hydroxyacyl-CoA dehydrogenase family protein [Desulfobulbaceae bacterium]
MEQKTIHTIACLGTGVMGHGVAFLAAKAGYEARLFGRSPESIERGLASIARAAALYEANALLAAGAGETILTRIKGVTNLEEAAADADLVMESVAENLDVKRQVFARVEAVCREDTIFATDTSGLDINAIAAALKRPQRFLAVHFFTPPYLMPTVEICPSAHTLASVCQAAVDWVESIGNRPIILEKFVPGFLINRIQTAVLREAAHIVACGWASPETVDAAVVLSLGRRYSETGPLESADMGGWDILGSLLDGLGKELSAAGEAPDFVKKLIAAGELGLKSGQGLYSWSPERIEERRSAREKSLIRFLRADMGK